MDIFELSVKASDSDFDKLIDAKSIDLSHINDLDEHKHTPLFIAISHGNLKMTNFLLAHGATLETDKYSVLHVACYFGQLEIAKTIYQNNDRDTFGQTPLILAAMKGHTEVCQWLLEQGSDINSVDSSCQSAFYIALRYKQYETAKFLLGQDNLVTNTASGMGYYPLTLAIVEGYLDIADQIHDTTFNINKAYTEQNTLLHMCAMTGNLSATKWVLKKGGNLHLKNAFDFRPIEIAAARGHTEVFAEMLAAMKKKHGSIKDLDLVLSIAASQGHADIIDIISQYKHKFSSVCIQASLMFATLHGHEKVIDKLLLLEPSKKEKRINKHYHYGDYDYNHGTTLLQAAADVGNISTVQHLFAQGASLNELNDNKDNVLHFAVKSGDINLVRWLCNQNVYPNQTNKQGNTPLHMAVTMQNEAMIRCLLLHGADSNIQNKHKETPRDLAKPHPSLYQQFESFQKGDFKHFDLSPLHKMAALKEQKGVMQLLPEADNIHIQSEDGLTPIQLAACLGRTNPLMMLLLWNAKGDVSQAKELAKRLAKQHHTKSTAFKTLLASAQAIDHIPQDSLDSFKQMIEYSQIYTSKGRGASQSSAKDKAPSSPKALGFFGQKPEQNIERDLSFEQVSHP